MLKWQFSWVGILAHPVTARSQLSRFPCSRPAREPPSVQLHSPCPSEAKWNGMGWVGQLQKNCICRERIPTLPKYNRTIGRRCCSKLTSLRTQTSHLGDLHRGDLKILDGGARVTGLQGRQNAGGGCLSDIFDFSHYVYHLAMGNFTALSTHYLSWRDL